jgi:putative ABC transport system substrate-binding protein
VRLGWEKKMRRRDMMRLLGGSALIFAGAASAQTVPKAVRIGLLNPGVPLPENGPLPTALARGLVKHGYKLGENLAFERRGAEGHVERLPQLVADLMASRVAVIATTGYPAARAAKENASVPIVSLNAGDPVATGLVDSLARPGGNLTGISDVSAEVTPKRMELLKQLAPDLRRVAVLWNADDLGMTLRYRASEAAAQALGVAIQPLGVREPDDFEQAFAAMNADMPDAILMVTDSLTVLNRKRVFEFAATHKLPAIYELGFLVRDGGLMSYGPDEVESFARVAALVGRILDGAKPAELPFEQPTKFALSINLKVAKSLGLTVPPLLLAQADDVIE